MNSATSLAKDVPQVAALRAALAAWFRVNQRPMPWRSQPSLYRTVVSEFMLQQTRVDTVRPYFERWTTRWADFPALARASEAEAVKAWEGLGYYTRARNLLRLARAVAAMPAPPRTAREWSALPGVGPYTAAAIASIACGEPVAVVDGNVVRVLARLAADARIFKDSAAAVKALAEPARRFLDPVAPGTHNQAVMELGALVCLPRAPLCPACPLASFCAARAMATAATEATATATVANTPENFPRFAPRKTEKIAITRLFCADSEKVLLHRHGANARRLAGIYEFPDIRLLPVLRHPTAAAVAAPVPPPLIKKRSISNQQITETIRHCHPDAIDELLPDTDVSAPADGTLEWIPFHALRDISLSGPHRKWLPALLVRHPGTILSSQ